MNGKELDGMTLDRIIRRRGGCVLTALLALCCVVGGCGRPEETEVSTVAEPDSAPSLEVEARLVADVTALTPGTPFTLAAHFTIPEDGHIYWRYPGDSGLATEVAWTLPDGFSVAPLEWPAPSRFEVAAISDVSYGYEREVLLASEVTPPVGLSADAASTLSANLFWLVCLEDGQCIPGQAKVTIELPSGGGAPSESLAAIAGARAAVPIVLDRNSTSLRVDRSDDGVLSIQSLAPWRFSGEPAQFFPYDGPAWNFAPSEGVEEITFNREKGSGDAVGPVAGVLSVEMTHAETGEAKMVHLRIDTAP
jgi:thiol:disulfide interchange protein DsbD